MPELIKTYWRDLPLQFTPKRVQNLDETALESLVKKRGHRRPHRHEARIDSRSEPARDTSNTIGEED